MIVFIVVYTLVEPVHESTLATVKRCLSEMRQDLVAIWLRRRKSQ